LHFPCPSEPLVLRGTLSCGARTFLPFENRKGDHLTGSYFKKPGKLHVWGYKVERVFLAGEDYGFIERLAFVWEMIRNAYHFGPVDGGSSSKDLALLI